MPVICLLNVYSMATTCLLSRKLAPKEAPAGVPVFRPYLEVTRGPTIEKSTFGETFQFFGGGGVLKFFNYKGVGSGNSYFCALLSHICGGYDHWLHPL